MHYIIQYLKHLLTASNQHGVHSPFVYAYVTKCLYLHSKYKTSKSEKIALKSIPFFKVEKLKIIVIATTQLEKVIQKEFGLKTSDHTSLDFIYSDAPSNDLISVHKERIHNDSMLLLANIHNSKSNSNIWKILRQDKAVTVSIDLFYCGVLFFRKEQVKEHFKIRF